MLPMYARVLVTQLTRLGDGSSSTRNFNGTVAFCEAVTARRHCQFNSMFLTRNIREDRHFDAQYNTATAVPAAFLPFKLLR